MTRQYIQGNQFYELKYDYKNKKWDLVTHRVGEVLFGLLKNEIGKCFKISSNKIYCNFEDANKALIKKNNKNVKRIADISDGNNTFMDLYEQRALLLSIIVNAFPEYSVKTRKTFNGTDLKDTFIVGLKFPHFNNIGYPCPIKYWDIFHCKEAPFYWDCDFHTNDENLETLLALTEEIANRRKLNGKDFSSFD